MTTVHVILFVLGVACILLVDFRNVYERIWVYCFIVAVVASALFGSQS